MPNILLVGASSQICRGWLSYSRALETFEVFYLSRKREVQYLDPIGYLGSLEDLDFAGRRFDWVVNFVGASNQKAISAGPTNLGDAMRKSDDISLALAAQGAHYIYLSSGAIYKDLPGDGSPPSHWSPSTFYAQEKLRAELRHSVLSTVINVSNLRVFGYLDRPSDALRGSLIGDLWSAFSDRGSVRLNPESVLRDIAGPEEVALALDALVSKSAGGYYDLFTKAPASSHDLAESLDLAIENLSEFDLALSPTGVKRDYFSNSRRLRGLGYTPARSTIEVVNEAFRTA